MRDVTEQIIRGTYTPGDTLVPFVSWYTHNYDLSEWKTVRVESMDHTTMENVEDYFVTGRDECWLNYKENILFFSTADNDGNFTVEEWLTYLDHQVGSRSLAEDDGIYYNYVAPAAGAVGGYLVSGSKGLGTAIGVLIGSLPFVKEATYDLVDAGREVVVSTVNTSLKFGGLLLVLITGLIILRRK